MLSFLCCAADPTLVSCGFLPLTLYLIFQKLGNVCRCIGGASESFGPVPIAVYLVCPTSDTVRLKQAASEARAVLDGSKSARGVANMQASGDSQNLNDKASMETQLTEKHEVDRKRKWSTHAANSMQASYTVITARKEHGRQIKDANLENFAVQVQAFHSIYIILVKPPSSFLSRKKTGIRYCATVLPLQHAF